MVLAEKKVSVETFEKLLEKTVVIGSKAIRVYGKNIPSGIEFEKNVLSWMCEAALGTIFEGHVRMTDERAFPDILVREIFGVEVKLTKGDKWYTIGNSILETNRTDSVEHIYLLFGKLGGIPEIRYKSYAQCVSGVGVTHSPRYKINMELNDDSFFDSLNIDYNLFRNRTDKITLVKDFYKKKLKEGESLWWIDLDNTNDMIMRNYKDLPKDDQENLLLELFIESPEVFDSKYSLATSILVNRGIICPNVRDLFSAGGTRQIEGYENVPAVIGRLYDVRKKFRESIGDDFSNWLSRIKPKSRELIKEIVEKK